mmetsp:Transcript_7014/g.19773  ORF Transcript_7014/g.19773 Transcript_7014/m.19773 type:complete len:229 (-) Transcript_7014:461-1147(-)
MVTGRGGLRQAGEQRRGAGAARADAGAGRPPRSRTEEQQHRRQVLQTRGGASRRAAHERDRRPAPRRDPGSRTGAHGHRPEPAHLRVEEQTARRSPTGPRGAQRPGRASHPDGLPLHHVRQRAGQARVHAAALRGDGRARGQVRQGVVQRRAVRLRRPGPDGQGPGALRQDARARTGPQRQDLRHADQGLHRRQQGEGGRRPLRLHAGSGHRAQSLRLPRRHLLLRQG